MFLLKLTLDIVFLCLHVSSGDPIQQQLHDWRTNLLSYLPQGQKLCLSSKHSLSGKESYMQLVTREVERKNHHKLFTLDHFCDRAPGIILFEEDDEGEEIALYNTDDGEKQAVWTWNRKVKQVSSFKNTESEIIFLHYDNTSFAYMHLLNSSEYHTCTITQLDNINNILIPTCSSNTRQIISMKDDQEEGSQLWYKYARLAIQDPRIADHNKKKREHPDQKFLTLPFFRKHIINDGLLFMMMAE